MFDGNGNWTSDFSAQADRDNGIKILASRFDNIFIADIKESFENCLTKDGQITPMENFNMGGHRITNLDDGVNSTDAVTYGQLQEIETLIKTKIYGVGSIYTTKTNTNPNTILGFGTWALVSSSVLTSLNSTVPVRGNGKALGLTSGGDDKRGLRAWQSGTVQSSFNGDTTAYNQTLPSSATASNVYINGTVVGVVTEGESGLIADMTGATSVTIYIWQRTA